MSTEPNRQTVHIVSTDGGIVDGLIGEEPGDIARHITAHVDRVDHVVAVSCHGMVQSDGVVDAGRDVVVVPVTLGVRRGTGVGGDVGPRGGSLDGVVVADAVVRCGVLAGGVPGR